MSPTTQSTRWLKIEDTVRQLCPAIERAQSASVSHSLSEYELRRELVGCLLGSQVSNESAVKWTSAIEFAGLLSDEWWCAPARQQFATEVHRLLSGGRHDLATLGRYRFFRIRADQIGRSRDALAQISLTVRLRSDSSAKAVRAALVAALPGIGPKQASMMLRNSGISNELAILDRHVLRYMKMVGLLKCTHPAISTLRQYERLEVILGDYAAVLGFALGSIDWAIWITMRAVREMEA